MDVISVQIPTINSLAAIRLLRAFGINQSIHRVAIEAMMEVILKYKASSPKFSGLNNLDNIGADITINICAKILAIASFLKFERKLLVPKEFQNLKKNLINLKIHIFWH